MPVVRCISDSLLLPRLSGDPSTSLAITVKDHTGYHNVASNKFLSLCLLIYAPGF